MHSSSTFCPLTARRCARPERWNAVSTSSPIASSWPEHHAAQQRRLGRRPGPRRARATPARVPVERAGQPAARRPGGRPRRDLDGGMRARRAWNASVMPSGATVARATRTSASDRAAPGGRARPRPRRRATRDLRAAERRPRPVEPDARDRRAPSARRRTGSSTMPRASIARPVSAGSAPGPSASTRAWASAAPASTATAASSASGARPASAAAASASGERKRRAGRERRGQEAGDEREQERGAADGAAQRGERARGGAATRPARDSAPTGGASRRSDRHLLPQRREPHVADPGDLAELLDRPEAAALLAGVEDLLRGDGADPGERVELLERRGVEVERLPLGAGARRGRRPRRRPRRPPARRRGTSIWRPSSTSAARLRPPRSARRVAPPARATASSTRAPACSS